MWNITSNSIQRAKEELQLRRSAIETRYAEEKQALDAEFDVIDALERAAAEFMARHASENGAPLDASPGGADNGGSSSGATGSEPHDPAAGVAAEGGPEATDRWPAADDAIGETGGAAGGLDIVKPGSRWRLYRSGGRPSDPDGGTEDHLSAG